jgi:hypothetical protein
VITLATLLTSVRSLSGDGPSDNYARSENLNNNDGKANGTNLVFYVQNAPIAPGGLIQLMVDNTLIPNPYASASISAINEATGQVIFAAGHAPTTTIFANYYYYLFQDATWQQFVVSALEQLNFSNPSTESLDLDVQAIPDRFLGAVKMLIRYWFAARVSQQTGLWYNQRLQERVEDRDNVSKKWTSIATQAMKDGLLARDDAYRGSGSKEAPSFRIKQFQAKPWTPYR